MTTPPIVVTACVVVVTALLTVALSAALGRHTVHTPGGGAQHSTVPHSGTISTSVHSRNINSRSTDTAHANNYHTLGCGTFDLNVATLRVCWDSADGGRINADAGEMVELSFRVVGRTYAPERAHADARVVEPYECGDTFTLLFYDTTTGASFAPVSIEADARACDTHIVSLFLPPHNGVYAAELRLTHIAGEGMADPSPELVKVLAMPAGPSRPEDGPFSFNVLFAGDAGSAASALVVRSYIEGVSSWAPRLPSDPECAARNGFALIDRAGWWLPPPDGLRPLFPRLGLRFYSVAGCPTRHVSARELEACVREGLPQREKVIVVGESIGGHIAHLLQQHSRPLKTEMLDAPLGEPAVDGGRLGRFDYHRAMVTPDDVEFADAVNPAPGGGLSYRAAYGLAVVEQSQLPPLRNVDVLALVVGANDAMREPAAVWEERLDRVLAELDKSNFGGTLALFTTPVRRYKGPPQGECSVVPGTESKYVCTCTSGDVSFPALVAADGGQTVTPLGIAAAARTRDGTPQGKKRPITPFFFNTHPRIQAFVRMAAAKVEAALPAHRRILVPYGEYTAGLDAELGSRDGVHACQYSRSLWRRIIHGSFAEHCEATHAAVDSLASRICQPAHG